MERTNGGSDTSSEDPDTFNDYAYLVEQAEDGLYMLDESGTFTVVNEAFANLTEYDRKEIVGSKPTVMLNDEEYVNVNEEIRAARRSEEGSGSILTTIETKSGQKKPIEIRFSLLPTTDGEYNGLTGVARDVRARRHREQKLDVLSRVLRHNVRNKINLIVGHASVIKNADEEQYQNAATKIESAADDLMDLSEKARTAQTEVGFNPSEKQQTDLVALLQHVAVQFRRDYPNTKITTDLPEELVADAAKSYQIAVSELVENAIEHCETENPSVRIRLWEENGDIRTVVEDQCPPIPESERQAINSGKETPLVHSLGMGLWLANWVAETLGGELRFERLEDDSGNRATILLHES
jgi:PAS domain S-box-containing protein